MNSNALSWASNINSWRLREYSTDSDNSRRSESGPCSTKQLRHQRIGTYRHHVAQPSLDIVDAGGLRQYGRADKVVRKDIGLVVARREGKGNLARHENIGDFPRHLTIEIHIEEGGIDGGGPREREGLGEASRWADDFPSKVGAHVFQPNKHQVRVFDDQNFGVRGQRIQCILGIEQCQFGHDD